MLTSPVTLCTDDVFWQMDGSVCETSEQASFHVAHPAPSRHMTGELQQGEGQGGLEQSSTVRATEQVRRAGGGIGRAAT